MVVRPFFSHHSEPPSLFFFTLVFVFGLCSVYSWIQPTTGLTLQVDSHPTTDMDELLRRIGELSAEDRARVATACGQAPPPGPVGATIGHHAQARISQFSGDAAKSDVSFEQWRFEVKGMLRDEIYSEPAILQAIRRSLRGTAAEFLHNMGEDVTVKRVLDKMERIFGNILPPEAILEQFYSAKQQQNEKVAMWACRLEETLSKLEGCQDKAAPLVSEEVSKTMLRTKFYTGLRPGLLKNALRHNFDSGAQYEQLLVLARAAELEEEGDKKTAKVHQASAVDASTAGKLDKVLAALQAVEERLCKVEETQKRMATSKPQQRPFVGKCYKCGQEGHPKFRCPLNSQQPASGGRQQAAEGQAPSQT